MIELIGLILYFAVGVFLTGIYMGDDTIKPKKIGIILSVMFLWPPIILMGTGHAIGHAIGSTKNKGNDCDKKGCCKNKTSI